jgi:2-amino-4-hydroxy-6-hydroxymethyldihydropteridine diphosphokinase
VTQKAAYIGLGSNSGNRIEAISTALEMLMALDGTTLTGVSSLYETSPVDVKGGPFLNAAARIETGQGPRKLLEALLAMETAMGRVRRHGETDARNIDLDLLLYGDTVFDEKGLILPHPHMLSRRFVMEPLAELAPGLVIPPAAITASEAAAQLQASHPEQKVRCLGKLEEVEESLIFEV